MTIALVVSGCIYGSRFVRGRYASYEVLENIPQLNMVATKSMERET